MTPVAVALLHSTTAVDGGGEPREKRERDDGRDEIENGHSDDDSRGGVVSLSCINYSLAKLEFDGNFPSLAFDFYTESCSALRAATSLAPSPT